MPGRTEHCCGRQCGYSWRPTRKLPEAAVTGAPRAHGLAAGLSARALSEHGQSVRQVDARLQASPCTGGSMKSRRALLATIPFAASMTSAAYAAPVPCEGLASLHLPDTTITVAAVVPAG